ncbi:hypothetical protein ILYODFUR_015176 [Ilyodon furcidens]|uniref:Uncharacterized protein n=1 Tax=Ilyodon furcidens TaxID=33524 RepID=A0ABV0V371_9TELE
MADKWSWGSRKVRTWWVAGDRSVWDEERVRPACCIPRRWTDSPLQMTRFYFGLVGAWHAGGVERSWCATRPAVCRRKKCTLDRPAQSEEISQVGLMQGSQAIGGSPETAKSELENAHSTRQGTKCDGGTLESSRLSFRCQPPMAAKTNNSSCQAKTRGCIIRPLFKAIATSWTLSDHTGGTDYPGGEWVTGKLVPISSSLWARGGVHPGQVTSPSQGNTNNHAHTHLYT